MTLTLELSPEEAARLRALAEAKGIDESGLVRGLLYNLTSEIRNDGDKPKTDAELMAIFQQIERPNVYERLPKQASLKTGAEVLQEIQDENLLGLYGEKSQDSPQAARDLRARAWNRESI